MSDLDAYRDRLGVPGPLRPDLATLRALHLAHLRTVPFENASVLFGEPIELDQDRFVHKLGVEGRGGFCYELNGAFERLLRAIGFEVALLEARGHETEGRLGPRFDHLALRVTLDEPWLVDVGFGYSFVEPLRLIAGIEQVDPIGAFRLRRGRATSWTSSGAIATAAGSRTTGWTRSRTRSPTSPRPPGTTRPHPGHRSRVAGTA